MSVKSIREFHSKTITSRQLSNFSGSVKYDLEDRVLMINSTNCDDPQASATWKALAEENPWVLHTRLVVKPDQLIKRRGKAGLLGINKSWAECVSWIKERFGKEQKVERVSGILDTFIVEPFVPHEQSDEYYVCLQVRTHVL
jgi:ATP citrate (pro-S)-lyase